MGRSATVLGKMQREREEGMVAEVIRMEEVPCSRQESWTTWWGTIIRNISWAYLEDPTGKAVLPHPLHIGHVSLPAEYCYILSLQHILRECRLTLSQGMLEGSTTRSSDNWPKCWRHMNRASKGYHPQGTITTIALSRCYL